MLGCSPLLLFPIPPPSCFILMPILQGHMPPPPAPAPKACSLWEHLVSAPGVHSQNAPMREGSLRAHSHGPKGRFLPLLGSNTPRIAPTALSEHSKARKKAPQALPLSLCTQGALEFFGGVGLGFPWGIKPSPTPFNLIRHHFTHLCKDLRRNCLRRRFVRTWKGD